MDKLKFEAPISPFKKIRIQIDGDYKWGRGWTEEEAKKFKTEVYAVLKNKGYEIEYSSRLSSLSSDILRKHGYQNKDFELYMHPMEFTGFATPKDIEIITKALNEECHASIKSAMLTKVVDVYDVSKAQYEDILVNNSAEILEWIKDYKKNHKYTYSMGIDFAKEFRPDIIGMGYAGGYSSLDIDVKFVENLDKIIENIKKWEPKRVKGKAANKNIDTIEK